jgi:acyl carrier protein
MNAVDIDKNSFLEKLQEVVAKHFGLETLKLNLHSSWSQVAADSLDVIKLVLVIETEFGIEIPDEDIGKLLSVYDLFEYLKTRG